MRPSRQQGFLLLPLLVFVLLAMLLITLASQDLNRSYLNHQFQLYQNCQTLLKQLDSNKTSACPPCPLAQVCSDD
ncbi:hypothetical protein [Marinospirillum sp.]|uniref:hypothetical protein n=1 Tax=Marinospirillum sp. TaxID=2183934 RepID=UPI0028709C11|nr:hypothetical protein [Marinospirillum sp.]MDR9466827.1 hypothetical protein [Marinospirillum sp.]